MKFSRTNKKYEKEKSWMNMGLVYLPTAIYAVVIGIVNTIYRSVAKKLNDWGMSYILNKINKKL
jgi:hypothetical protein